MAGRMRILRGLEAETRRSVEETGWAGGRANAGPQ